MCDYVEVFGLNYCGTWNWTGSVVTCKNVVRFSTDESSTFSGFRLEYTEIPAGEWLVCIATISNISVAAKPVGSQCLGDITTECQCGTECLPWTPGGGSWDGTSPLYCLYPQPLAHLESCNYTEKRQLCDTGLMCEQGVCVRADKYKWDKINSNQHRLHSYYH